MTWNYKCSAFKHLSLINKDDNFAEVESNELHLLALL